MSKRSISLYCWLLTVLFFGTGITDVTAQNGVRIAFYKVLPKGAASVIDTQSGTRLYYNPEEAIITNKHIASATAGRDENFNLHTVTLKLTPEGTKVFAKATAESVGKRILVMANKRLLIAPVVQGKIEGGEVQITGGLSEAETKTLAAMVSATIKTNGEEAHFPMSYFASLDNAMLDKDVDRLKVLVHPDARIEHSNGWVQDKNALIADLESGKVSYSEIRWETIEEEALEQNFVRIRRTIKVKGQFEKYPFDMKLSVLEMWQSQTDGTLQLWSRKAVKISE
ncbi:nuclear transport factor 2 family protein [Taibaiella sp. KBW10]|uniref:nuclear transport factor 2 family protein n=1 Tax=Taibaiella sp. KBW10 TaxID=2153357 RepID=UPI0013155921|nr:nuclear transport factor 2 family protein [Taibaiella sp. KBW10]